MEEIGESRCLLIYREEAGRNPRYVIQARGRGTNKRAARSLFQESLLHTAGYNQTPGGSIAAPS